MDLQLRPLEPSDIEPIVELSLAAWAPVFESFANIMGPTIFARQYPDWRQVQRKVVEETCHNGEKYRTWVAEHDGTIAGFISYTLDHETRIGETYLLAVHPDHQNQGVATALNELVLTAMREQGMELAFVGTGGDPGHAPARRAYEKAGYIPVPTVVYYKAL